jgi:hypothetical protein
MLALDAHIAIEEIKSASSTVFKIDFRVFYAVFVPRMVKIDGEL